VLKSAGVTKSNFGGVPEVDPAAAVAEGGFKPLPGAGPPVPKSEPARPPGSAPLAAAMMGVPQLAIAAPNSNVWGTPQAMTPALPSFLSAQQPPPPPPDFGGASPIVDFGSVDFAAAAAAAAAKLMGGVVPAPMAAAPAAGLNLGGKGLFGLAGLLSSTTSQASECGDFKRGNCSRGDSCRFAHTGGQASPLSSVGGARPPPPMAGGPRPEIGDDVEVLHNGQWKNGTALGVTGDGLKLLTLIPEEGLQLEIEWNSVRKDGQGMGPSGGVGFSKAGGPPQTAKMQAVSVPSLQSFAKLTFGGAAATATAAAAGGGGGGQFPVQTSMMGGGGGGQFATQTFPVGGGASFGGCGGQFSAQTSYGGGGGSPPSAKSSAGASAAAMLRGFAASLLGKSAGAPPQAAAVLPPGPVGAPGGFGGGFAKAVGTPAVGAPAPSVSNMDAFSALRARLAGKKPTA